MATDFEIKNPSGDRIRGNLHLPSSTTSLPCPVVILCHGFKSFKDWGFHPYLADQIAQAGIAAVRFNFSHNGTEEDPENFTRLDKFALNTIGKEIEDLKTVLDAVSEKRITDSESLASDRFGILGHSRGAASSILVGASDPRIKAIAAWAGIATVDRWSDEVKEAWRNEGEIRIPNLRTGQEMPMNVAVLEDLESHRDDYDLLKAVESLTIPLLVVHGDEDETVPFHEASLLHDQTPRGLRKLQIVPGAGHTFGAKHPFEGTTEHLDEAVRVTLDWFATRLAG